MHRVILDAPADMCVDHINGNPLDNRRENLRLCTRAENNRAKHRVKSGKTSRYKGVYLMKKTGKWIAGVRAHGKYKRLGSFENEADAARAYNEAAKQYYGEFAVLNVIDGDL